MAMITTFQQHIQEQQQGISEASGTFSYLLAGITLATKMIQAKIRLAAIDNIYGAIGQTNVQGEQQQKLDVYANEALLHCLGLKDCVAALVSEEDEEPVTFDRSTDTGKYIIVFDPLDGSSNIDVNVNVGTIFSILKRQPHGSLESSILRPGHTQVGAGYVVYGPSTVLVYTVGNGVHSFTLDHTIGAYVLAEENMMMPEQGSYYSTNEANANTWPDRYREYLELLRSGGLGREYSSRYIGSLVADFHRTLLKGGVFLYPPTMKQPKGKLRLLYEANPLAFIAEQAGGAAIGGSGIAGQTDGRILDIHPEGIHQRTPFMYGSKREMAALAEVLGK
jgi:fructose-1,6-bisphosphatase I